MKNCLKLIPAIVMFLYSQQSVAQQTDETSLTENSDTTISNYSAFQRSLSLAGVLQTRYVASFTKNVDVNGKNFDTSTNGITNTFLVKRARVMLKANVNDHFSANVLVNLADFNGDPSNKVLENAYIKYSLNKHFNVQAGQFRPFFGIEDAIAVDIIRTLDFSNQYYAFAKNGWQSFQIGLSIFGTIDQKGRVRYFGGVYNGNNKNAATDNDNTKNFYGRLEVNAARDFTIAVNGSTGSLANSGTGSALGGDFTARIPLSKGFFLLLMGEYKNGTNFVTYNSVTPALNPELHNYRMQGFYFFPTLRYEYKHPRVRALELSCRYEYFDQDYINNSNPQQTFIPNLSLIFADNFYAALQMGVSIDLFKNQIPLTSTYNHNLGYLQLQIRI
ncbi:porin [Taibaiella soli]|uniref:Porin n=1 Tax=Taibaiella soli TaxID=1649169 RepID=A0A2W2B3M1_9BACT|nr:porin [Taibaiella soli]PZF74904.1 porin [Taibaiella soli]